mmetsp:Transcript_84234/g.235017  ORF Transcript_84234/g.235017 Transcript_84234/m.235017 type:complete len:873 (+) Transcript_84234:75-2693(+)
MRLCSGPAWRLICLLPLLAEAEDGSCTALATSGAGTAGSSLLQQAQRRVERLRTDSESNSSATGPGNGSIAAGGVAIGDSSAGMPMYLQRTAARDPNSTSLKLDPATAGVDEPETAPSWEVTIAVGFGAAMLVVLFMIIVLYVLNLLVQVQARFQQHLVSQQQSGTGRGSRKKQPDLREPPGTSGTVDDRDIMALVNGEQDRLALLLVIAESAEPSRMAADLVQKSCQAYKLRLSKSSEAQIGQGVVALAKAVQAMSQKRKASFSARERLRSTFQHVLEMVKVCRALKLPVHDHEGSGWTVAEVAVDRYDEGTKPSTHKDVKIVAGTWIGAYFASERVVDHGGILFIFLYSQLCGIVYAFYLRYRFPKMYDFMGPWILVSRGEAMSLIVLTVLMVLLLTRSFMTFLRRHVGWSAVLQNIVDKHTLMHQWCARMLPVCAVLHILGHFRGSIPAIIHEKDSSKIDQVFTYGTRIKFNFNSWVGALQCYPAVTGFLLVLILVAFWSLSNEYVRRKWFELFHYPHLILIVAWTLGLWAHGARQWLGVGVPLGFLAVTPAVLFYFISRWVDLMRGINPAINIKSATLKKKAVLLEIDTEGSGFAYETGMYCMLKVPAISEFEWHPFTIASAGGTSVVKVLFAVVGDWTIRFKELLAEAQTNSAPFPTLCMRGGYGAPAEGMKDSKHVVLVGAGVGATPFLSFLASFCASAKQGKKCKFDAVESAIFYWVSREPEDFVWVNEYNSVIQATPDLKDRISVRLCLTKSLETTATKDCTAAEVAMFWLGAQVAINAFKATELAAELGAPTQFGRPNWHKELRNHATELLAKPQLPTRTGLKGELEINVFVCGNAMLVASLEEACDDLDDEEVIFRLFAEQF